MADLLEIYLYQRQSEVGEPVKTKPCEMADLIEIYLYQGHSQVGEPVKTKTCEMADLLNIQYIFINQKAKSSWRTSQNQNVPNGVSLKNIFVSKAMLGNQSYLCPRQSWGATQICCKDKVGEPVKTKMCEMADLLKIYLYQMQSCGTSQNQSVRNGGSLKYTVYFYQSKGKVKLENQSKPKCCILIKN